LTKGRKNYINSGLFLPEMSSPGFLPGVADFGCCQMSHHWLLQSEDIL
jgi:hypothetical protein